MKEEVWKDVPGPKDATINYQISNHGRVRRLSYTAHFGNQVTSWEKTLPDKILKGSIDSHGYAQVKKTVIRTWKVCLKKARNTHLSIIKRKKYSSSKMIKFHSNGVLNTTAAVSGLSKVWN